MLEDILIPLLTVSLAEFGDKTQLTILLLSLKTEKRLHLLFGVVLAFLLVDGIAILLGEWIANILPINLLKIFSGSIFVIFGILMLIRKREGVRDKHLFKNPFPLGLTLIFLSEWGDKTQVASGLLATKYNGLGVLIGVMAALTFLSLMAIYLGKFILRKTEEKKIGVIGGILFILIGISFFLF